MKSEKATVQCSIGKIPEVGIEICDIQVHKECRGIKDRLTENRNFDCGRSAEVERP